MLCFTRRAREEMSYNGCRRCCLRTGGGPGRAPPGTLPPSPVTFVVVIGGSRISALMP